MVASDNTTVRQLDHLARSARIDAGEVAAEGWAYTTGNSPGWATW